MLIRQNHFKSPELRSKRRPSAGRARIVFKKPSPSCLARWEDDGGPPALHPAHAASAAALAQASSSTQIGT
ncbi:hypothetical protein [Neptunicoccus sediminis]|uniref:hypothetical protein n=1 Tax=Neptunicoccus sediminis TaxID=1892596 RepID=UPI000845BFCC|nr:hypothetical protein [Neptunicoccus sediminis]